MLVGSAVLLALAVLIATQQGGGPAPPPLPGLGTPARPGDPFAYVAGRDSQFAARATSASAQVLFTHSPGGAIATAARVASLRSAIEAAARGTGVDPDILEGIVFVESAGRPEVIAGSDPSAAAGLTQILAETGRSLLGMRIDLARSRRLTQAIAVASAQGNTALTARLERRRAAIDERFDAGKTLAATVRYLQLAARQFGRSDLAVVSYHMGIGNLRQVLDYYDGGRSVPYPRLFFDTAPDHNSSAYHLLAGFGDQSSLYYWRVLGAVQVMRRYRSDRGALARLAGLQTFSDSSAEVLHPPDRIQSFGDPDALSAAYATRAVLPLPSDPAKLGLSYSYPSIGSSAKQVGAPRALYRGLRAAALDLLIELAARVRALSGSQAALTLTSAVTDQRYQQALGIADPPAATGYSFQIARRYASRAQAGAFQAMLDRLQALNLIAWSRTPTSIEITVASDAGHVIAHGP